MTMTDTSPDAIRALANSLRMQPPVEADRRIAAAMLLNLATERAKLSGALEAARKVALEEAAKVAEEYELSAPDDDVQLAESSTACLIAADIRALMAH